jgi:hypothetical protein
MTEQLYTTILLYPDYMQNDYPHETSVQHIRAETPAKAVALARRHVATVYEALNHPEDMFLIAVFAGHHLDLSDGDGNVE